MKNKNYIRHVPYLRNSVAYDHDFWYTWVKWWYLQAFFSFFSTFWFFGLLGRGWGWGGGGGGWRGVKGQKTIQNDKKFCWSRSISQELYIWLSFMLCMCQIKISPVVFFKFSKFWFSGLSGGWKGKNYPKWQKILSFKILIFWVFKRVKGQKNLFLPNITKFSPSCISSRFLVHRCKIISSCFFLMQHCKY